MYNLIMKKSRYLLDNVLNYLDEKMVFIDGSRQVRKTTFVKDIIGSKYNFSYYNWDNIKSRLKALNSKWDYYSKLIILDEFHKYSK
jgi:predicted AAA+ superfamily ATPase